MTSRVTPDDRPARPTRWFAWLLRGITALFLIGLAAGGIALLHMKAGAKASLTAEKPPLPVATVIATPEAGYSVADRFAGRVEPARETALSFERPGLLVAILYEEGDRITAGDVIARLDTEPLFAERDMLLAERRQLTAELELARLTEERQKTLHEEGHASAQRYDEARLASQALAAGVARVDAAIRALDIDIAKSEIIAPFNGRIADRFVDDGGVMAAGDPVVHVLETDRLQVRIGLSPDAAASLEPGDAVTITHDGAHLDAHVVALRPDLSTATRTVPVIVAVANGDRLLVGSLVELIVPRWIATPGTWLPLTALAEGPKGLWTVYAIGEVDGGHVALREAVEVLHVSGDRAFVRGTLAPDAQVISGGHHRIVPDQRVALTAG